jgi:sulfide:quinone oxidoreductase
MTGSSPLEILVAGGGVGATELVLALDALAGRRARVTLLAPNDELDIRALQTLASVTGTPPPRVALLPIAVRTHARLEHGTLDAVDAEGHVAVLGDGRRLPYDVLVLAVGAAPARAYEHGVVTLGADAGDAVAGVLDDLASGRARSGAFVVPPGVAWTLPLYELALLAAQRLSGSGARLIVVTPEQSPLALFGPGAAGAVRTLLTDAGIELHLGSYAAVDHAGRIELRPHHEVREADRIVALARPVGRAPGGIPSDDEGFVTVDDGGRVRGVEDVFAVGDVTSFPVKQGGLACQLADVVAEQLAARAGASVRPRTFRPILRGQLLAGDGVLHLSAPIAGGGGAGLAEARPIWRPSHKVDALHLSRLLEDDPAFGIPPVGLDVVVRLPSPSELERDPLALDPYSPQPMARLGGTS